MRRAQFLPYLVGGLLGAVVGLGLLLAGVLGDWGPFASRPAPVEEGPRRFGIEAPAGQDSLAAAVRGDRQGAIIQATRRASPAVVSITVIYHEFVRVITNPLQALFPEGRFGHGDVRRQPYEILGSGVILDPRGYIVTNDHVLGESKDARIFITLGDGRQFEAELVGRARQYDLALLRFTEEVEDMPVAVLGDSDDLEPGEWAIAIGAPYRYLLDDPSLTVTVGVISAVHRDFREVPREQGGPTYLDMIQTDATINQGNSGGALVNAAGEVVGINTFILSARDGGNLGAGFAVPIDRVRWVMEEVLEYGGLRRRFSGFDAAVLDRRVRYMFQVPDDVVGLYVYRVYPDSPAQEAGLKPGDVIQAVGGVPIRSRQDFIRTVYDARVGTRLDLEVQRDGQTFETSLTLVEGPVPPAAAPKR